VRPHLNKIKPKASNKNRKRKRILAILVSQGINNKFLQTECFQTTEVYCLAVLEAEVCNQDISRTPLPPKALGKNSSLPLWLLVPLTILGL
jgi:hypothetical protein